MGGSPESDRASSTASEQSRIRSIAQKRFRAVGRAAPNCRQISSKALRKSAGVEASMEHAPKAIPIAAATPMAGAPRTVRSLIAVTTWR